MSEQLGRQYDSQSEYAPARLEHELEVQNYMRSIIALGISESQIVHENEKDAQASILRIRKLMRDQLGPLPVLSDVLMQVSGENVKVSSVTINKDEDGEMTIKTTQNQLGMYETRAFQYTHLYGSVDKLEGTEYWQSKLAIIGLNLDDTHSAFAGDEHELGVRVALTPTISIPCEEGVELDSVLALQAEKRVSAMEELMRYSDKYPHLLTQLMIIEQEVQNAYPGRRFELKSIDQVRQTGELSKEFSAISERHADVLNTAVAEVFTRDKSLELEGSGYTYDKDDKIVKVDVQHFYGTLVDVVYSVPTLEPSTGQAFAISVEMSQGEQICYIPLSQIKAIHM